MLTIPCVSAAQPERIEGLDHPALGVRPAGQEHVGPPVEEHQDGDAGQAPGRLLQPQLQAGRHAPHVAHLEVEDDQVGELLLDGWEHGWALVHGA